MKKKLVCVATIIMFLIYFSVLLNTIGYGVVLGWEYSDEIDADWTNTAHGTSLSTATQNVVGTIINTIRIIGTGIAIIMLTYVAIKYIMAAPQEKADFKKSATAYIVGAIVLFASTNILTVIADFASSNIQ